jgi:hypothetical protein
MAAKQSSGVPATTSRVYFAPVRQPTRDRLHRDRRQAGKGTWRAPLTISVLVARARKYLRLRLIEIETRLVSDLVSMRETAAG